MNIRDSWPAFALMVFAVASGQIGRLGRAAEQGAVIGRKTVLVEMTMLPGFGALGGALAAEYSLTVWMILAVGIAAGWTGFGTFRLIVTVVRAVGQQMTGGRVDLSSEDPKLP